MEKFGFGLTRKELLETVGQYVAANGIQNPFKSGVPGEDWFLSFKKRHNLSIKKPQPVEYARKQACSPNVIYPYFNLLEETINDLDLGDKPSHIWNVDETSFSKDPSKSKVVGCKGFTSTRTIASPGKDNTTVLLGCNALGEKTPPMIIYKGKNVWDEWTTDEGYPGTAYAATSNGWMETAVFEAFFEKVFLKTVGEKRPILLIYDGHATHVGINIIKMAREANITIMKIPPHTSHLLQPLDLAVNKSFKDRWDAALIKWQRLNIGKQIPKKEFAKILGQIWTSLDPAICAAGFKKAGIYPLNKYAVPEDKFNEVLLRQWKLKDFTKDSTIHRNENSDTTIRNPDSLLTISLKAINNMDLTLSTCSSMLNVSKNLKTHYDSLPKQLEVKPASSNIDKVTKQINKIQILENRIVTFEDLLLMKIKAGTSTKTKRKRMATGAEVITRDDVLKTLEIQKSEKDKKTTKTKEIKKFKQDNEITNETEIIKNQPGKFVKQKKGKNKVNFKAVLKNHQDDRIVKQTEAFKDTGEHFEEKSKKVKKESKTRKNRKRRQYSTSSSELETELKLDDDSDDNDFWENLLTDSNYSLSLNSPSNEYEDYGDTINTALKANKENIDIYGPFCENDWLLVKFCSKKSIKHYVGVVLSVNNANSPVVKYCRKKSKAEGETVFTFPLIDDISEVKHTEDIVTKLPKPTIGRRGQIIFKMLFNSFNVQ